MKPLISYYGGKQRIASRIVEQISRIDHKIYAEPFCGGCAVLYAKPEPCPSNWDDYREAINDTNQLVVNLYRVAREQPDELHDLTELTVGLIYSDGTYRIGGDRDVFNIYESDLVSVLDAIKAYDR